MLLALFLRGTLSFVGARRVLSKIVVIFRPWRPGDSW